MSYSARMQKNLLYSVLLAPRGRIRMADAGAQIAQMYLSPFDQLIGIIGEAGSGKSMLIRGMFPGLELTNDDEGVNVRPLPLMDQDDIGFFKPHTYHLDVRFELGFYQVHELAEAVLTAIKNGKRVVVEHFEMLYSMLGRNADLIIGIGEELIVTRPSVFGPDPQQIRDVVYKSIIYRKMAHTTEDLVEMCLGDLNIYNYGHADVRHGFILSFTETPDIDLVELAEKVQKLVDADLPVSYVDDNHVRIGDRLHYCTGPRMHVPSTGHVKNFRVYPRLIADQLTHTQLLVGVVGFDHDMKLVDLNRL